MLMKLVIDMPHRYACMRAHTATHLLHAELTEIFPQTKQAGSFVGPDELRFDFFADRALTNEELVKIAQRIQDGIATNDAVSIQEMPYEQAIQTGAKAFFEDSYPEIVRVVSIGSPVYSIELCGGTHVDCTGQIGSFVIVEQTAVAAGVKRIVALTGVKVAEYVSKLHTQMDVLAHKVGVPVKQLEAKIDKILGELQEANKTIAQLSQGLINTLEWHPLNVGSLQCDAYWQYDEKIAPLGLSFADAVAKIKHIAQERTWILVAQNGQYAFAHPQAKQWLKEQAIKGG